MQHTKAFWAALAIAAIWLMVALVGVFSRNPGLVVPVAGFAAIPSILLALLGFREPPASKS